MKRFWRIWMISFDLCTHAGDEDACRICWGTIKGFCKGCMDDGHLIPYRQTAKYIFTLLHVLQKRRDSLFFGVDKNVLEKIIRYALNPDPEKTTCSIVKLECKHMFHRHCYEEKLQKKLTFGCYRCHSTDVVPVSIKSRSRVPYYIHIEICTEKQMGTIVKKRKIVQKKLDNIKSVALLF